MPSEMERLVCAVFFAARGARRERRLVTDADLDEVRRRIAERDRLEAQADALDQERGWG